MPTSLEGRHVETRALRAFSLRERGLKWREIADRMGYETAAGPYCALYQGAREGLFL